MENPGRLACTEDCLYFQPFNNISTHSDNKYPLQDFKRVIKRRYLLHHRGLEVFVSKVGVCLGSASHLALNPSAGAGGAQIFFRSRLVRKTGASSIFLAFQSEEDRNSAFDVITSQSGLALIVFSSCEHAC